MKSIGIALACVTLMSGCASYFTLRPPVIEDKVGKAGQEVVGTLATAPDYRVVYVRLAEDAKLCAEAPADAAAQFGSVFAASVDNSVAGAKPLTAEAKLSLAVAMKQLFKRSQGVQFFRDASFALCNLYLNKGVAEAAYLEELKEIRKTAAELIKFEIPHLEKISLDPVSVPTPADLPNSEKNAKAAAPAQSSSK